MEQDFRASSEYAMALSAAVKLINGMLEIAGVAPKGLLSNSLRHIGAEQTDDGLRTAFAELAQFLETDTPGEPVDPSWLKGVIHGNKPEEEQ